MTITPESMFNAISNLRVSNRMRFAPDDTSLHMQRNGFRYVCCGALSSLTFWETKNKIAMVEAGIAVIYDKRKVR